MGAGLWIPPHYGTSPYAFIDPVRIYGEYDLAAQKYACQEDSRDHDSLHFAFQSAKTEIRAMLPPSYSSSDRWHARDEAVWAENALAMLVTYEDSYSRLHLALVPKLEESLPGLARNHVKLLGPRFLARVAKHFGPLSVRSSAWTSVSYDPVTSFRRKAA